jgi:3-oxoacyl-(acyl-carrier-protein) synthase
VLALESIRRQQVFPVAGFEQPEHDVELAYVRELRTERVDCVLVTSLGLGGVNVAAVLEAVRPAGPATAPRPSAR